MTSGGAPSRREPDSPIVGLLGQLQRAVDQAKADRVAARTVPCDRTGSHPAHTYVATAKSGIDLHCPGRTA